MDVRFLPNPYFVPELKPFSGLDSAVREYLLGKAETGLFLDKLTDLLDFLVAGYRREGKTYLTVSIGCTGGRHRSVVITEELRRCFETKNIHLKVTHRDLEKG
jgi:UPF0042 nucleotide-binding protein